VKSGTSSSAASGAWPHVKGATNERKIKRKNLKIFISTSLY
jgi:hypothetical protein